MSFRLSVRGVALLAVSAVCWPAACGSGDTTVSTSLSRCVVYPGDDFVPEPPDGEALCPQGACNFQSQAGCSATETCSPHYDSASNSVVPACVATGTQKAGAPCDNTASQICAPGLICADGACAKPCCGGDYTVCGAGESCIRTATIFKTAQGTEIPYDAGLGTCAPVGTCNVLDPTSCSSDATRPVCRIVDARGYVACRPHSEGGDADLGEPCNADKQCAPGLHCAGNVDDDAAVQTTCVRLCAWGSCDAKPACGNGEGLCVHFARDPDGVGECTVGWRGEGIPLGFLTPDGGATEDAGNTTRD